jgi:hypothetical protein
LQSFFLTELSKFHFVRLVTPNTQKAMGNRLVESPPTFLSSARGVLKNYFIVLSRPADPIREQHVNRKLLSRQRFSGFSHARVGAWLLGCDDEDTRH